VVTGRRGNAKPLKRQRSRDEQLYWDGLSPRERVAFLLGYTVGQDHPFPAAHVVDFLRQQMGDHRALLCTNCAKPLPTPPAGAKGRPPTRCESCRTPKRKRSAA